MFKHTPIKYLVAMLIGIGLSLSLFSPSYEVKADDLTSNPVVTLSKKTSVSMIQRINTTIENDTDGLFQGGNNAEKSFLHYTSSGTDDGVSVSVNMSKYNDLSATNKTDVMNATLKAINNSNLVKTDKTRLYNFVAKLDTGTSAMLKELSDDVKADFFSAAYYLKPFNGWLGIILGVFTVLLLTMLTATVLVDLAYIALPIFRNFLTPADPGKKPKFVSQEAVHAVETAESTKFAVSSTGAYFKSKSKQFIFIAICILYLTSGKIFELVGKIVDMFQGVIED